MPGFELIGKEEKRELDNLMDNSGILFRHGFDNLRNGVYKTREFEKNFSNQMNVQDALAVTSGTAALLVALKAFGIGHGDEVITQSFTFVATVEAIVESGAKPIICDIDSTLNLDPEALEAKISNKTKAIIVVHMLGTPCNLNPIIKIAEKNKIKIIEDTAWGCGGKLNGKYLGTIGDAGTYSFDFAKTITTGEGGMTVFKNKSYLDKAKAYHDHGHENNPLLPRWEDSRSSSGFNYRMSELQGAIGIAQLKKLSSIVEAQRANAKKIKEIIVSKGYELRKSPDGSFETSDAVVFFADSNSKAKKLRDSLLSVGISTKILPEAISWHFAGMWNHIKELEIDDKKEFCKKSLAILNRAVAIPVFVKMDKDFFKKLEEKL